MDALFNIDYSELIRQSEYSGLIVFLITFLESLLLVGFLFPGSVALMAIGGLISAGYLELWPTLFWAFAGAVLGDNLSFWIGVYLHKPLVASRLYAKHRESFARGEAFFSRYGAYSVILGRFVGPIRAVIPSIAGMMGMSGKLFFVVNFFSALIWAPAYILPGVFFGEIYHRIDKYIQLDMMSLSIITGMVVLALILIKKSRQINRPLFYVALLLAAVLSLTVTQTTIPG